MPLAHDLLQPVPECILEAYARFVASDHDRALDDRRFHEDTPNGPTRHSLFCYGALSGRPAFAAHRSNIRDWFCDYVPARIPDQLTSSFSSGSAGIAIFFRPASKLSGSVTGLPQRLA